jgi:hypothetical protein
MDCFPEWLVWALGATAAMSAAGLTVLVVVIVRDAGGKFRYARRLDPWPSPAVWICGVPGCRHKYRMAAWLHAAWKRPWLLRRG